jgi:hypothetical protein
MIMRIDKVTAGEKRPYSQDRLAKYGITSIDFATMLKAQDGLCAICKSLGYPTGRLVIDHDHSDGMVRGLLCIPCNNALGLFRDSRGRLIRALRYLRAAKRRRSPA